MEAKWALDRNVPKSKFFFYYLEADDFRMNADQESKIVFLGLQVLILYVFDMGNFL